MGTLLEELVGRAHHFLERLSDFHVEHEHYNKILIAEAVNNGLFDTHFIERVTKRDYEIETEPYLLARNLLGKLHYDHSVVQALIEKVKQFRHHRSFSDFGVFLSEMINNLLTEDKEIVIDTGNTSIVHVQSLYAVNNEENSYPWNGLEQIKDHNKENLLISKLASKLTRGKIIINGNVGDFFAYQNSGAVVQLNGECGWRPCYAMKSGQVIINGTAGHGLATYADGGEIFVNGKIRSIGGPYTTAYGIEIHQHGIAIPKKQVDIIPRDPSLN